ncbi:MAG: cation:proton antiporter [Muribaculaceae bacterium]|nr:cation:proton antiporter [Muribaculaceae bacterium]
MFSFPLQQPVAIFLLVLLVILLGPLVFRRLKIPQIVGLILAGMAVGPYGFNLLDRDSSFRIFGEVGILYIMFLAAVEIDMFHLRKYMKKGIVFGLLSFSLPMLFGIFGSRYAFGVDWTTSVLIASMYASHTLVSYPTVSKFGLSNQRAAVVAVCGTIVAVLLALIALAQVVTVHLRGTFQWQDVVRLLVLMVIYAAVVGWSFPWLTRRFFKQNNDSVSQFIFILALVFVASLLAKVIGLEAILGAFYAGLVLNKMIPDRSSLMRNIRFVGNAIFIPYFLIGVGMLINVGVIVKGWNVAWVAANMTLVALVAKWLAAYGAQKMFRFSAVDRRLIFGLSSGKAAATIAATMIGYEYGMLSEDVMNGAVVMILFCCIVSSLATERSAKKIRMAITAEDLSHEDMGRGEYARQVVAVSNPLTSAGLMKLALFMRAPANRSEICALFVRNSDDPGVKAMGRNAMREAVQTAENADIRVKEIERFDINVASALSNVGREVNNTEFIIGLHRKGNIVDTFYGSMVEQLLRSTNKMIFMSRCFIPLNTVDRIFIVVPENAEFETGFQLWIMRLANLGAAIGARLIILAYPKTEEYMRAALTEGGYEVRYEFRTMCVWDDFILLSGQITEEDILVVIGARKGSLSCCSELDSMPGFLGRHFSRHNLIMVYPKQF